ncbi:MAG TPA: YicC/YloC family endoribonuclease [Saprospiraceae bacterium]|nr:YicC/YloC family endoribonuclease [Saprospiraceae bacterium]
MIQSMTGYGRGMSTFNDMQVLSEIRSLNSKITDLRIKLPVNLGEKEIDLRNLVLQRTQRGKIEMTISFAGDLAIDDIDFDKALIKKHFRQLQEIAISLGVGPDQILHEVLKLPNVLRTGSTTEIDQKLWGAMLEAVNASIDQLILFREHEGRSLFVDLLQSVTAIHDMCNQIDTQDQERLAYIRGRMKQKLEEFANGEQIDTNRFEQEVLYYLERLDINEEKVRLQQHCNFFKETLKGEMEMKSKQLNFIAQELGREINTLGAKAQWSPLQHLVVGMKNELEKIKEQLANIV